MIVIVVVVLALVFSGVHIAVALGVTAVLGIYLMLGDIEVVRSFVANTAYEALRDYVFAVIPLFILMGDFVAKSGAARDLYSLGNRLSRWLPARLAVATIVSNALFAFVTGVSIAAAAAFSRIAYPEMMRFGYERKFALGCIAGKRLPGHAYPAIRADDRLGGPHRALPGKAVPGRGSSGTAAHRFLRRLRGRHGAARSFACRRRQVQASRQGFARCRRDGGCDR